MKWRLAAALLVGAALPVGVAAQSAQMFSLQVSALGAYPFGGEMDNIDVGGGWEAQLRVNPSAFSIGAGIEQTFHQRVTGQSVTLLGGFIEPRYVVDIGSDNAVLYLSGRAAWSQTDFETASNNGSGITLNGGGGFLFPLAERVNLDVGATVGYKTLGELDLPVGSIDLGSGANVVGRVGLAIGLG